jgi:hypothetical protein
VNGTTRPGSDPDASVESRVAIAFWTNVPPLQLGASADDQFIHMLPPGCTVSDAFQSFEQAERNRVLYWIVLGGEVARQHAPRGRLRGLGEARVGVPALERRLEDARGGQSRVLVVRGDPGIGTTGPSRDVRARAQPVKHTGVTRPN